MLPAPSRVPPAPLLFSLHVPLAPRPFSLHVPTSTPFSGHVPAPLRLSLRLLLTLLAGLVSIADLAIAQDFTRMTGDPVSVVNDSRSVNWIDYDGDDDLDLFVSNAGSPAGQPNQLFRNDAGTLVAVTGDPVVQDDLRDVGATWGDHDNDGDPDPFCTTWYGDVNGLWDNQGDGSFVTVTTGPLVTTGTHSEDASWVDTDLDGDLDLYLVSSGPVGGERNRLYRNDGGGTFVEDLAAPITQDVQASRHGAWGDYDDDGDLDVLVANELGQNNRLYRNLIVETGTPTWLSVTDAGPVTSDGGQSWSASWGDFDNDGDLDLVVGNWDRELNFLYRNELVETGSATFTAILDQDPAINRGYTASTSFADWDNDGDLDLLLTSAFAISPDRTRKNFFYRNDGGVLVRVLDSIAEEDEGWTYGAAWGDWDGDGDLDLHTARCYQNAEANILYRNEAQGNGNHWLTVKCVGTVGNRSGIGARARVKATIRGAPVWQLREVTPNEGYASQNLCEHFGLGDATLVDSLVVRWPSGTVQVLESVPADQKITITEPDGATDAGAVPGARSSVFLGVTPNPFRTATTIRLSLDRPDSRLEVRVHDVAGRLVRSLDSGPTPAGSREIRWDGRSATGSAVAPGVYFVRATGTVGDAFARVVRIR